MIQLAAVLLFAAAAPAPTSIRQLQTEHYNITIREFCPQDFDCNHVEYQAVSNSGKSIHLHGSHIWHDCPGTHDPCHPIGYLFKNNGIQYLVTEDGSLIVTKGSKTLMSEQGKWSDE